jgi:hypothetical protein
MIIAIDSNVLLSVFSKDSLYEQAAALLEKYSSHEYVINDCVYLELGVHFSNLKLLDQSLDTLEISLVEGNNITYKEIINAWTTYLKKKRFICPSCGKAISPVCPQCQYRLTFRQRILTDFLIGGFASANSDGIITFDSAYYKNYFPTLKIFK